MKSTSGFSLYGTVLVLCISSVHSETDGFDCRAVIRISDAVKQVCPQLAKKSEDDDTAMSDYAENAVIEVYKAVYNNCNASVERICDQLPEIVVSSNVGGREMCKDDLKDIVCEKQDNYFRGGLKLRCLYYELLYRMVANPEKWKADSKSDICILFKGNLILCYMATRQLCDRINSVLVKNYCQNTLERGICHRDG